MHVTRLEVKTLCLIILCIIKYFPYLVYLSISVQKLGVISYNGYSTLLEVKAKTGNTKSSKTVMNHPDHYGKTKLIKIGDYNVSENDDIITIPHYLAFVLGKTKYNF